MLATIDRLTRKLVLGTTLVCAGALAAAVPAAAQSANDFYKGKTITLVISAGPGGGYATYVLTMTKHMQGHIPGNPDFIRQHRQGAGGVVAAQYLYNAARRDGTVIATIHRAAVSTSAVFRESGVNYDPRNFSWIGSINKDTSLCVSYHTAKVKTFKDALETPLIVGGLGTGSDTDIYPTMFNNLFGTKFKLVTGYNQGTAITLAMERGEVEGRCGWSWSSINATQGQWLRDNKLNLLVVGGLSRDPGIPESVPMVRDLAETQEQRDILELAFAPQEMARPVLGPPEVPRDRLEVLRAAFDATMKDPAFLEEARQRKLDISPLSGKEVEDIIASLMSKPESVVNATIEAISRKDRTEVAMRKADVLEVKTRLDEVKNDGRVIAFKGDGGAAHEANVSSSQTKISIGGQDAQRAALKAGMDCTVKYGGDKSTAELIACN